MCLRAILGVSRRDMKRNTELRLMAGIQRVEVMVMRRRLHWLRHVERIADSRIPMCLLVCQPYGGKRSVGGQKRRWNDLVLSDLKKIYLLPDSRDMAHERGAWRCLVKEASAELNRSLEEDELKKKDERKLRREGNSQPAQPPSAHLCTEPGCNFVGQTKAGLVNHTRQRHGVCARAQYPYVLTAEVCFANKVFSCINDSVKRIPADSNG